MWISEITVVILAVVVAYQSWILRQLAERNIKQEQWNSHVQDCLKGLNDASIMSLEMHTGQAWKLQKAEG